MSGGTSAPASRQSNTSSTSSSGGVAGASTSKAAASTAASAATAPHVSSGPSTATLLSTRSSVKLPYSIAAVSSFSGSYKPENIIADQPQDISSRWSGAGVATVAAPAVSPPNTTAAAAAAAAAAADAATAPSKVPSSGPLNGKQYIVLKVTDPSVVKSIVFGKFHKAHPCNLRDFKVYGGPSPEPSSPLWVRLLRAGLKNDAIPEEFPLRWNDDDGVPFPVRYIKVVPLATHSPNYNFSVWHVALRGVCEPSLIARVCQEHAEHRESTTTRLILKHLRARGHHAAFNALLQSSKLASPEGSDAAATAAKAAATLPPSKPALRPFEHPLVTQLFQAIMRGDWDLAEMCLDKAARGSSSSSSSSGGDNQGADTAAETSLFASFVARCAQQVQWKRLYSTDADGDVPGPRGGHSFVVDSARGVAYLFGGWNGQRDLNDLWIYYIAESRWRRISSDTTQQGGPGPRSCHKMAFDSRSGIIYVLGRFVDGHERPAHTSTPTAPAAASPRSTPSRSSTRLDPSASEAASLLASALAVPGSSAHTRGSSPLSHTSVGPESSSTDSPSPQATTSASASVESLYSSDFYRFSTRSERWDRLSANTTVDGGPKLIFDHEMVVDEENQMLYVFGGRVVHWNPNKLELSGMWRYDCIQRTWTFLFDDDSITGAKIPSRAGHSMLLDVGGAGKAESSSSGGGGGGSSSSKQAQQRLLWILGGQRGDKYLADMHTYNLVTGEVLPRASLNEGGFTQRACIDAAKREIYQFSGLVAKSKAADEKLRSAFWLYRIDQDQWSVVWKGGSGKAGAAGAAEEREEEGEEEEEEEEDGEDVDDEGVEEEGGGEGEREGTADGGDGRSDAPATTTTPAVAQAPQRGRHPQLRHHPREREPRPRYAAQMVYEPRSEVFLIFGGNPADPQASSQRLNDLWRLELIRPRVDEVLRRVKFALRQQRFREMAAAVPRPGVGDDWGIAQTQAMEALWYLQTEVAAVVDHSAAGESRVFRRLVAGLLEGNGGGGSEGEGEGEGDAAAAADEEREPTSAFSSSSSSSTARESDGLPAVDEDAEMLSVSQVLPGGGGGGGGGGGTGSSSTSSSRGPGAGAGSSPDYSCGPALSPSQRGPPLFKARRDLFRTLLRFFAPEAVEPAEDLQVAVGAHMARMAGGRRRGGGGGAGGVATTSAGYGEGEEW